MNPTLIIDKPQALKAARRHTEWSVNALAVALWVALCRPLLAAIFWVLGARQVFEHMIHLGGWTAVVAFFSRYIYIILLIALALKSWNAYNRIRYGRRNRRRPVPEVLPEETEKTFSLPAGAVKAVHSWKECWIRFEPDGRLRLELPPGRGQDYFPGSSRPGTSP